MSKPEDMYQCQTVNCGYVYDPDKGDKRRKISPGTSFDDLPQLWYWKEDVSPPGRARECLGRAGLSGSDCHEVD